LNKINSYYQKGVFTEVLSKMHSFKRITDGIVILALTLFLSCKKSETSISPIILEVRTEGMQHGNGLHAIAGDISRIRVTATDDLAVIQLKCSLSTPAELHSHSIHGGGLVPAFRAPNIGIWEAEKSLDASGTETTQTFKFNVPDTLSGAWDIIITALDDQGNLTHYKESIIIQNDSIPAIIPSATTPTANADGIVALSIGETMMIEGNILDGDYLQSITASLYLNDAIAWQQTWSPVNTWMFDLSQIIIPPFYTTGNYTLRLGARDRTGRTNWMVSSIEVK